MKSETRNYPCYLVIELTVGSSQAQILAQSSLRWECLLVLSHIFVDRISAPLKLGRCFPRIFGVPQPKAQQMTPDSDRQHFPNLDLEGIGGEHMLGRAHL